jgi:O-antigen/teichoic acid export membrane protein
MSLFGAEFQQGWLTLSILATSAIPVVLNNVLGQVLQSGGSIWRRFSLDLLLAGIYALLVVSLIPLWQENGMALASLLAFSMTTAPLFVIVRGMIGNRVLAKKDM